MSYIIPILLGLVPNYHLPKKCNKEQQQQAACYHLKQSLSLCVQVMSDLLKQNLEFFSLCIFGLCLNGYRLTIVIPRMETDIDIFQWFESIRLWKRKYFVSSLLFSHLGSDSFYGKYISFNLKFNFYFLHTKLLQIKVITLWNMIFSISCNNIYSQNNLHWKALFNNVSTLKKSEIHGPPCYQCLWYGVKMRPWNKSISKSISASKKWTYRPISDWIYHTHFPHKLVLNRP